MRKKAFAIVTIFVFLLITWLPCYGEDNVIYGCYKKNNGQLRIVSNHSECLPSELPISWNGIVQNPLPKFEGDICWNVVWQNRPNYVMKLRVTATAIGYYIVQSDMENVGENLGVWFGSARLVGNQIRMSVQETHSDSQPIPTWDADHYGCQYFLDLTTLNGTGWCTGVFYNPPTNTSGIDYLTGTLTYTTCP